MTTRSAPTKGPRKLAAEAAYEEADRRWRRVLRERRRARLAWCAKQVWEAQDPAALALVLYHALWALGEHRYWEALDPAERARHDAAMREVQPHGSNPA